MKRVIIALSVFVAVSTATFAQTMEEVTQAFNAGAEANNQKDYVAALESFEKCIKIADEVGGDADDLKYQAEQLVPGLYFNIAMDDLKAKKYEEAIEGLKKSEKIADEFMNDDIKDRSVKYLGRAYYAHAADFYKADDYPNAVMYFKKSLEIEESHKPYYYMALISKKQDNIEEMIERFNKVIDLAKKKDKMVSVAQQQLFKHYFEIGQGSVKGKNYDNGIENLEITKKYGGDENAIVSYYLAEAYVATEAWDKAVEAANEVIRLESVDDDKAKGYYQLGFALKGKGDTAGACEAFAKAALSSNFEAAANYQRETELKCQ